MGIVDRVTIRLLKAPINVFLSPKSVLSVQSSRYSTKSDGLLSDINVLDITRVIAGPVCTMTLGDLGANVIKVESHGGDDTRRWGPPFFKDSKEAYYNLCVNRSKKSICIDFKSIEGKNIIYDLARKCDVVVENYLPGKLDQLDVGYNKLKQINKRIIYCAITGFGPIGPYRKKPGYDVIAAAMGGLLNSTGERNGDPVKPAVAVTDITTGLHAFGAIMTALYYRTKTGKGQKIDCNLLSTQISSMTNIANNYLNCGIEGEKWGMAHSNIVPYQGFKTKDGHIVLGTGSEAQFADFCKLINKEELITDERFKDNEARIKNREEITRILSEVIITKTRKEWMEIFKDATFPNGPVNSMKEVFEDEHVKEIGLVKELPHPLIGTVKVVAPPTVYSEGGNKARMAPPLLGQHTKDILSNFLGYHDAKIDGLFKNKVESVERVAVITLRPTRASSRKKVVWTEDTVDNENMNKKKSKCCCIYEKPRRFDESDSETSDDECEHCFGHVEHRRKKQQTQTTITTTETQAAEQTASITLQPAEPAPSPPDKSPAEPAPSPPDKPPADTDS